MGAAGPLAVAGGLLGAYGAIKEGDAKADALEEEARASEENAIISRQAGIYDAQKQSLIAKKTIGAMKADYAASGVSSDSFDALEVLRESHTNAELDRQNIVYQSEMKAKNYSRRSKAAREGASATREAATINAFASLVSAGASAYAKR